MKPSKDIQNELRDIAPILAGLNRKNFYTVSEGYFAEATEKVMILADDISHHAVKLPPVLASLQKTEDYKVPHEYFAHVEDSVMAMIHRDEVEEELGQAIPILSGVPKTALYEVPVNYFAVFPMIATKMAAEEQKLETPMGHEISRWSVIAERLMAVISRPKYSFAMACMVAVIALMAVISSHKALTPEEKIFAQMQQVSDHDLQHYMGKHRDDFDERTILHNINDIEFTHYFDKAEDMPAHLKGDLNSMPDNIGEDIID